MSRPFALAADLDGTLLGDAEALAALLRLLDAWDRPVIYVYLTGRHYRSACEAITAHGLPPPAVLVTDVGGAIHWHGEPAADPAWAGRVGRRWNPLLVEALARSIAGLEPQEVPTPWRRSYSLAEAGAHPADSRPRPVALLRHALHKARLPCRVVFSGVRNVDVLPQGAAKGTALRHVARRLGLAPSDLLVAGDSGNDVDMLVGGFPAVLVGNAQPEVAWRDLPGVYRARLPNAWGVIEALHALAT